MKKGANQKKIYEELSPSELTILNILWNYDKIITSENIYSIIQNSFPDKWTKGTISSLLNRMIHKEALSIYKTNKAKVYIYIPISPKKLRQNEIDIQLLKVMNTDLMDLLLIYIGKEVNSENRKHLKEIIDNI